jgi:hypothetical protein
MNRLSGMPPEFILVIGLGGGRDGRVAYSRYGGKGCRGEYAPGRGAP